MIKLLTTACLLVMLALFSGCTMIDYYFMPPPDDTAQELFETGSEAMRTKQYFEAAEYFAKLKDRYPFSPYTPKAEIGLGDALFQAGRYADAAEAYKEFESLHPRHEQIPYVLLQIGIASYNGRPAVDLPQDMVVEGMQYLNRLRETYPDTPYAEKADEYIVKCRQVQAEYEVFVANFYWNRGKFGAAYERYQFIMSNFKDLPEVVAYATQRAEQAYLNYQSNEAQTKRDEEQGSWKDWFNWL